MDNILEIIPVGKENAISRIEFANRLGCSDRKARDLLHTLKCQYPIVSNTGKGGYYMPETVEEAEIFDRQLASYVKHTNMTRVPLQRFIEQKKKSGKVDNYKLKNQLSMFGEV